ncbi:MAG: DUF2239 family protein [Xanthobacteraceae bacterium]
MTTCTAFTGTRRIASGPIADVALAAKPAADRGESVLIFDDATAQTIEIDFRGNAADVSTRLAQRADLSAAPVQEAEAPRGPGRPKLGVVAREVTLLPRHWDWLASQPGGASVALRKLVEHARRANGDQDRVRIAREVAYRFMSAMVGDLRNLEEASRALFAGDAARFYSLVAAWPEDIRDHAVKLAADGLA